MLRRGGCLEDFRDSQCRVSIHGRLHISAVHCAQNHHYRVKLFLPDFSWKTHTHTEQMLGVRYEKRRINQNQPQTATMWRDLRNQFNDHNTIIIIIQKNNCTLLFQKMSRKPEETHCLNVETLYKSIFHFQNE